MTYCKSIVIVIKEGIVQFCATPNFIVYTMPLNVAVHVAHVHNHAGRWLIW